MKVETTCVKINCLNANLTSQNDYVTTLSEYSKWSRLYFISFFISKSVDVKIEELDPPTSVIIQQGMLSGAAECPLPRPVAFHGRDHAADTKLTTTRDNAAW